MKKTPPPIRSTINDGGYSFEPKQYTGPGEDREFRTLLGWPKLDPNVDRAVIDKDFDAFVEQVNAALSAYSSLPDGDLRALRTSDVRDEASRLNAALATLSDALEPTGDRRRPGYEALLRVLSEEERTQMIQLHEALDNFQVVFGQVLAGLVDASARHGETNMARQQTISDLERLFNVFVADHPTTHGRSATELALDRGDFVALALEAAGIDVPVALGDSAKS